MRTVSPLVFDFNTLEATFDKGGRKITLKGCQEIGDCKAVTSKRLQKLLDQGGTSVEQLHSLYALERTNYRGEGNASVKLRKEGQPTVHSPELNHTQAHSLDPICLLLMEFEDLFATPTSLPPHRFLDHSIHLKPNVKPINLRAYRYSPIQKVEIEKLIKDMMDKSLIQPNQSPFASLDLLVKKK